MENGEYESAAVIFERLANGAQQRGMVKRAPYLYLQAARAHLKADQENRAESLLYYGLDLLAENGQWNAMHRFGNEAVSEYRKLGSEKAVQKLEGWLHEKLKDHPESESHAFNTQKEVVPRLPAKCPSCGATIRPNEVEWLDQHTAKCLYCGSAVQAQI